MCNKCSWLKRLIIQTVTLVLILATFLKLRPMWRLRLLILGRTTSIPIPALAHFIKVYYLRILLTQQQASRKSQELQPAQPFVLMGKILEILTSIRKKLYAIVKTGEILGVLGATLSGFKNMDAWTSLRARSNRYKSG